MIDLTRSSTRRALALGLFAGLLAASASASGVRPVSAPGNAPVSAAAVSQSLPSARQVSVQKIDFSRNNEGAGLLTLTFDGPEAIADLRNLGSTLIVDVPNGVIPEAQQKPIIVSDFGTPISRVDVAQTTKGSQLVVSTQGQFKSMGYQTGNRYVVEVAPPREASKAIGAVQSAITTTTRSNALRPGYSGKPVTFNFQDVPVRTILQLIAEESGVNIVAADSVSGNVTLRLNRVPWDQALDIVLQSKSLDKRRSGNVIWVAPQAEIAKFEQDKEDARIALDNRADMATEYVQINYHNAGEIFKALTEAKGIGGGSGGESNSANADNGFLSSRGKIVADARTNTLIISDIPRKIEEMKKLIAVIDRPVDQVLIEARVVIANESFARDLGARFGISGYGNDGQNWINSNIENNVDSQNSVFEARQNNEAGTITRGIMSNLGVANPAGSIALSILRSGLALDVELSALQQEGNGEVISNPRIVTSNQREAVISQGREVGYVTIQPAEAGGVPTPNVQFKEALLEMKVTPTITDDGRVFLVMNVKKDEVDGIIDTSIGQVPQISKRNVNTAVLVQDGQTIVIGGVYEFRDRKDISKVPFLGDVPFLGNLFKKRSKAKNKAELLIMVTPRVLRVARPLK